VDWSDVGGLDGHLRALKEMVVLPLLYPELFARFSINAPRGVLFFGPPGTGKTLVARALANSCSQQGRKVAFFMRKGADCLSKWVGEAERQLRLLFEEATRVQPSIIFFDEIDGLAPVRSSRQDQIHSSIVSTLLALMDGLDSRYAFASLFVSGLFFLQRVKCCYNSGQVIVIGATNRPDAIDPALRRPGRFDRELMFALPSKVARRSILSIHTKSWSPPLSSTFLDELAEACVGYCGADLKSLCTESCLRAVRRRYPQIYKSSDKLVIDPHSIRLSRDDFMTAMKAIVPASQRSSLVFPIPIISCLFFNCYSSFR
jgi:SpoVK/Ycf46/Vps4 family AAA+-type ATPase